MYILSGRIFVNVLTAPNMFLFRGNIDKYLMKFFYILFSFLMLLAGVTN